MKTKVDIKRRRFLKKLGLAVGGTAALGLQNKFSLMNSALAASYDGGFSDSRSLVCIFLHGGNDTWNMRVPRSVAAYQRYANIRQNLAVDRDALLSMANFNQGWHPAMPGVRSLFDQGKLGVVQNVGALFAPVDRDRYFEFLEQGTPYPELPPNLFSHSHMTETVQTGQPSEPGETYPGWGGRTADFLSTGNSNAAQPSSYSFDGNNFWQAGDTVQPYGIRPLIDQDNGKLIIDDFNHFSYKDWPPSAIARSSAWQDVLSMGYANPLEAQAARSLLGAKQRTGAVRDILSAANTPTTPYNAGNPLAMQLHCIAQLISAREALGTERQIFFAGLGGWDTHANHVADHADRLGLLDEALLSFQQTLAELGVENSVTTFSASEFGRTFTSNGDGTDHAWAGDCLVMGGAVDGGRIHGEPISYSDTPQGEHWGEDLFGAQDVGSGRFIPRYSTDQYGATLARWMGLAESDISLIFPNLDNFASRDLGFMA